MEFIFETITAITGVNIADPHQIPFAGPLVFAALLAVMLGSAMAFWFDKDREAERLAKKAEKEQR